MIYNDVSGVSAQVKIVDGLGGQSPCKLPFVNWPLGSFYDQRSTVVSFD